MSQILTHWLAILRTILTISLNQNICSKLNKIDIDIKYQRNQPDPGLYLFTNLFWITYLQSSKNLYDVYTQPTIRKIKNVSTNVACENSSTVLNNACSDESVGTRVDGGWYWNRVEIARKMLLNSLTPPKYTKICKEICQIIISNNTCKDLQSTTSYLHNMAPAIYTKERNSP